MIKSLYKAGLPEGNIFDFTASRVLKFEHKWNTEQKRKAILEKYKNMGKDDPRAILEKSVNKSERSMSAKTAKSAKNDKPEKADKNDKKDKADKKDKTDKTEKKSSSAKPQKKK